MEQHKHVNMDFKRFIIFAALVVMLLINPCYSLQEVGSDIPSVMKQEQVFHQQWRKLGRLPPHNFPAPISNSAHGQYNPGHGR
ncbi:hypothetical protein QJS04_geneDACA007872 [Acorus gramineus]|uniref:Uncharacterized protein n=1 Tax=Acorus gramineus TaxID=55184 RepID=A0AAV9BAD2_ACOGR|nr:hypothetical protein QJS04_geneDACA007872 [Acorus gramineus]